MIFIPLALEGVCWSYSLGVMTNHMSHDSFIIFVIVSRVLYLFAMKPSCCFLNCSRFYPTPVTRNGCWWVANGVVVLVGAGGSKRAVGGAGGLKWGAGGCWRLETGCWWCWWLESGCRWVLEA